jgi:hypothetical protein
MRAYAAKHLKGNIWYWVAGFAVVGAAFLALGWSTPAAFCFMITGLLTIFADAHIDPVALITEDALHPDEAEAAAAPRQGAAVKEDATLTDRAVLILPWQFVEALPEWAPLAV